MTPIPQGVEDAMTLGLLGYRVFPVELVPRDEGSFRKRPLFRGWQKDASSDPAKIRKMWMVDSNAHVGILVGNGLILIDPDSKNGKKRGVEVWRKYMVDNGIELADTVPTTPSGGKHIFLRSNVRVESKEWLTDVDVKGDSLGGGSVAIAYTVSMPPVTELQWMPEVMETQLRSPEPEEHSTVDPIGPQRDPALPKHPYAAGGVRPELGKLDDMRPEPLGQGWKGVQWDPGILKVACNLIEIGNSPWSGYTLDELHEMFLERAPEDKDWRRKDNEEKWENALSTVGGKGRPDPDDSPAKHFDVWIEIGTHPIFDATAILSQIRQAAHARMVGSGALLCYVLGRVLAEVPSAVVLPPVVGGPASLNLAFALVGRSGSGKSSTSAVSEELLGLNQSPIETGVGSGEGLMEAYHETQTVPDPDNPGKSKQVKGLIHPPTRILEVDEIGHLGAVSKRDGSSLMPVIRTALTGGALKAANATAERRRNIGKGTYRLIVFVGIQPELAGVLLDDANAGTPQRFVWVSTVDKTLTRDIPEWPGEIDWSPGLLELVPPGPISYPDHVRQAVLDTRYEQVHGDGDPLKGHELLTRLKVSAGLAFLHGEIAITDQWWDIAGHIITWSTQEQARCQAVLNGVASQRNQARGRAEAEVEQAKGDAALTTIKASLVRKATKVLETKDKVSVTDLRHHVKSTDRAMVDPALEELAEEGRIKVEVGEYRGRPVKWVTHVNQG